MGVESVLPLALFTLVATITPGGATTMVTASAANFGVRRSAPLVAGIAVGLATTAAAAGLAGALPALPSLQLLMKLCGTVYLLRLAWKSAHTGAPRGMTATATPTTFLGGAWMLWHNPKGWATTMGAAAASFGPIATGPPTSALLLAAAFGIAATISLTLWCVAGQLLARVPQSDHQWRLLNCVLALLLALSIAPMWLE